MRTFSLAALLMLSASTEAMVSSQNLLQFVQEYEYGVNGHVLTQVEEPEVTTTSAVQVGSTSTTVGATIKPQLNVTPVTTLAQDVEAETEDDLSDAVQDLSDEIATLSNEIDELSVQVDSLDDDDEDDEDDDGDAVQNAGISVVSNDNDEVVAGVSVDATESTESTESTVSSDPSQNSNSDGISSSDLPDGMMVTADGEIVPMNTVLENENGNTIVLDTTGVTLNADPCNTILNDTGNMTADQIAAMLAASGC